MPIGIQEGMPFSPLFHIRSTVFAISQGEMAKITGTTQSTISRWERGELEPDRSHLALIRDYAKKNGIRWNDALFFDPPPGGKK